MSPIRLHLFVYQVGFGDCFLLRFVYPGEVHRHVLIDFGSMEMPDGVVAAKRLLEIAEDIKLRCNGKLQALVATHRHADHINGFATRKNGKGAGDIIRSLAPDIVVQPWTEQPDLPEDATAPIGSSAHAAYQQRLALRSMSEVADSVLAQLDGQHHGLSAELVDRLGFLGRDNVSNLSAVENLASMGGKQVYAWFGSEDPLAEVLPGITTRVLGPPTLEQSDAIRSERSSDPEYWIRQRALMAHDGAAVSTAANSPFPEAESQRGSQLPLSARWIAERVRQARGEQWLQIVTALDDAMNNTSLILLFEAGGKKLLFPGDAQIENWRYALNQDGIAALLEDVDLYKVGHHGSLNATPKSLWEGFDKRGPASKADRLTSVLSTKPGRHGHVESDTEVPRRPLVAALEKDSTLHDTDHLAAGVLYEEVVLEL